MENRPLNRIKVVLAERMLTSKDLATMLLSVFKRRV